MQTSNTAEGNGLFSESNSLAKAADAAAKVSALLISKGQLKQPKVESNYKQKSAILPSTGNLIVAEVDINDAPIACRNQLTRGATQEEISRFSGATISTRGRFISNKELATNLNDRPLYLCIQAANQKSVDSAISKINAIIENNKNKSRFAPNDLAPPTGHTGGQTSNIHAVSHQQQQPQPLMAVNVQPPNSFFQEKLYIGLEHAPPAFNVKSKITGPSGIYLIHIQSETRAQVSLRGRGSAFLELDSGREAFEPMHIHIQHATSNGLQEAKTLATNLISTVQHEYAKFQQALVALSPTIAPAAATFIAALQQQYQQHPQHHQPLLVDGAGGFLPAPLQPPPNKAVHNTLLPNERGHNPLIANAAVENAMLLTTGLQPGVQQIPGLQPGVQSIPGLQAGVQPIPGLQPSVQPLPGLPSGVQPNPALQHGLQPISALQPGVQPIAGLQPAVQQIPGLMTPMQPAVLVAQVVPQRQGVSRFSPGQAVLPSPVLLTTPPHVTALAPIKSADLHPQVLPTHLGVSPFTSPPVPNIQITGPAPGEVGLTASNMDLPTTNTPLSEASIPATPPARFSQEMDQPRPLMDIKTYPPPAAGGQPGYPEHNNDKQAMPPPRTHQHGAKRSSDHRPSEDHADKRASIGHLSAMGGKDDRGSEYSNKMQGRHAGGHSTSAPSVFQPAPPGLVPPPVCQVNVTSLSFAAANHQPQSGQASLVRQPPPLRQPPMMSQPVRLGVPGPADHPAAMDQQPFDMGQSQILGRAPLASAQIETPTSHGHGVLLAPQQMPSGPTTGQPFGQPNQLPRLLGPAQPAGPLQQHIGPPPPPHFVHQQMGVPLVTYSAQQVHPYGGAIQEFTPAGIGMQVVSGPLLERRTPDLGPPPGQTGEARLNPQLMNTSDGVTSGQVAINPTPQDHAFIQSQIIVASAAPAPVVSNAHLQVSTDAPPPPPLMSLPQMLPAPLSAAPRLASPLAPPPLPPSGYALTAAQPNMMVQQTSSLPTLVQQHAVYPRPGLASTVDAPQGGAVVSGQQTVSNNPSLVFSNQHAISEAGQVIYPETQNNAAMYSGRPVMYNDAPEVPVNMRPYLVESPVSVNQTVMSENGVVFSTPLRFSGHQHLSYSNQNQPPMYHNVGQLHDGLHYPPPHHSWGPPN